MNTLPFICCLFTDLTKPTRQHRHQLYFFSNLLSGTSFKILSITLCSAVASLDWNKAYYPPDSSKSSILLVSRGPKGLSGKKSTVAMRLRCPNTESTFHCSPCACFTALMVSVLSLTYKAPSWFIRCNDYKYLNQKLVLCCTRKRSEIISHSC